MTKLENLYLQLGFRLKLVTIALLSEAQGHYDRKQIRNDAHFASCPTTMVDRIRSVALGGVWLSVRRRSESPARHSARGDLRPNKADRFSAN